MVRLIDLCGLEMTLHCAHAYICNRGIYSGKSDRLVLTKYLAFFGKPQKNQYEFRHTIGKTPEGTKRAQNKG